MVGGPEARRERVAGTVAPVATVVVLLGVTVAIRPLGLVLLGLVLLSTLLVSQLLGSGRRADHVASEASTVGHDLRVTGQRTGPLDRLGPHTGAVVTYARRTSVLAFVGLAVAVILL